MIENAGARKLHVGPRPSLLTALRKLSKTTSKESAVYFPSSVSSLTAIGNTSLWYMTVVEPMAANKCSIRRTLYTTRPDLPSSRISKRVSELGKGFKGLVSQLETQYREICELDSPAILTSSQEQLRKAIQFHVRNERAMGRKISPALPLEIAGEVNSSKCGIAEKRKAIAPLIGSALTYLLVCRELDGLADATSCLKPGSMSQSLSW